MAIRVVRLGTPRKSGEGPRLGTVRRPPRGVRKADYSNRDYYDVWLPELAPSAQLLANAQQAELSGKRWDTFRRRYLAEMARPPGRNVILLLASLSRTSNFSVGCYCEDESHCHRTLLRDLLVEAGAEVE
jgi:uncharacterized protein YeaO (DUF488 family)